MRGGGGDGRFIPAWAGNTAERIAAMEGNAVHPRVGGEHAPPRRTRSGGAGSSPRGRGTQSRAGQARTRRRFIPAWAGNTIAVITAIAGLAVHPRVGGEHPDARLGATPDVGSSPRGRGTRDRAGKSAVARRFIPAWAGNTPGRPRRHGPAAVHPRVGGEHILFALLNRLETGSSPRGRGTHPRSLGCEPAGRFIPAWAGNTDTASQRGPCVAVHPRVGGEHDAKDSPSSSVLGSSPRGRGTLRGSGCDCFRGRFIPAWAGNTRASFPARQPYPVHPRVGGEHT